MSSIRIETKAGIVEFGVMSIPNCKSKCLYKTRGARVEVLAYFISDQQADEFNKIIEIILKAEGSY